MGLYRDAKFFSSGSLLVMFFYILLGIFSYGLLYTISLGWDSIQILYLPIIIGLTGIGRASQNFAKDTYFEWDRGKLIAYSIYAASILLLSSIILFIITTWFSYNFLVYIGNIFLIFSCIFYTVGFFLLQRQLSALYLKKIVVKYPNYFIIIGFGVQSISYVLFFVSFFVESGIEFGTIAIIGMSLAAISIILLIPGFIQLNIIFRAYPHLVENEGIRPN